MLAACAHLKHSSRYLHVAAVGFPVWYCVLEWLEVGVIDLQAVFSKLFYRLLFRQTNEGVFEGCEHSRRHLKQIHLNKSYKETNHWWLNICRI